MSTNIREKIEKDLDYTLWSEVHGHFVKDKVFLLDESELLIDVALALAEDDSAKIKPLIDSGKIARPDGLQVQEWRVKKQVFLCAIVEPFVLVQLSDFKGELKQD